MNRKPISPALRRAVYAKYGGHCAYCGCEITSREMRVDHINSVYSAECNHEEVNDTLDNLNPSCQACNFYKQADTLDDFREHIKKMDVTRDFNAKFGVKYGRLAEAQWDGLFYFERIKTDNQ